MFKLSKTKWEVSDFGGFGKVIRDHPNVKVGWDINYKVPDTDELTPYIAQKLVEIFLLKVKETEVIDTLLLGAKTKMEKRYWGKVKRTKIRPSAQEKVIDYLISLQNELSNLFRHFRDLLINTEIYHDLEVKDRGEKPDSSEGMDGEGTDRRESTDSEALEEFESLLNKVAVKERWTYSYASSALSREDLKKDTTFRYPTPSSRSIRYTTEETTSAEQLLALLDISFESDKDKLGDLRTGKLDVARIAEVPAGNLSVYYRIEENQKTRPFSFVILGDESGSMEHGRIKKQKTIIRILYKALSQVLPADKLYVYGHSGNLTPIITVYHDPYNQHFEKTIDQMRAWGENYDGPVIERIYEKVREMTDDNIIFVAISDGSPVGYRYGDAKDVADMKRVIEKCKRDGFVTLGIGIDFFGVPDIYNYRLIIKSSEADYISKISQLINKVVKTEFQ